MRSHAAIILFATTVAMGGCASYEPAPLDPAAIAAEQRTRHLDDASIRAELKRLAPEYQWEGGEWNSLTLFAAALTAHPEIARARARLQSAKADASVARVHPGPTLSLTAEYAFNYAFNPPEASPWLFGAASEFLGANGGRKGRINAAEITARAAQFDFAATLWSVRMAVRRAVDTRVIAGREALLAASLVDLRHRQFEAVRRQADAGEVSRLDLDLIRADTAAASARKAMAEADIVKADIAIAAAVGAPPAAIDLSRLAPSEIGEIPPLTDDKKMAALGARSEILKAAADYEIAEAAVKAAVAAQYPEVRLGPGYTWERGLSKLPFTLNFTFPSADFNAASIRAAEARRREAGRQLEAAVASVMADVDRADADYRAAAAALDVMRRETIPAARAIAEQSGREFEAGGVDRAEWAASQAGLAAAKLDEATAIRMLLVAEASLEDALRQPLSGPDVLIRGVMAPQNGETE